MTDYFALLQFPRAPWLEAATVNDRFLELSRPVHPDHVHNLPPEQLAAANKAFADLNLAAATLRESKERVQHLLELETGAASQATQNIPAELIDLFAKIGQSCRAIDQFLAERARASSPILQAQLFAQGLDWTDRLTALQQEVASLKERAEQELQRIAAAWPESKPIDDLRALAHRFAMIARWESQLKERFATLAIA